MCPVSPGRGVAIVVNFTNTHSLTAVPAGLVIVMAEAEWSAWCRQTRTPSHVVHSEGANVEPIGLLVVMET